MTAHVAERGEGRGRVVLRLACARPVNDHAIAAAIKVAKAFHSEIESVFVADRQLFDAAAYSFASEIGPAGARGTIEIAGMTRQIELAARALLRRVEELAHLADVPVYGQVVHDTPIGALARACQAVGPWNVVALSEAFTAESLARLGDLFERVTGMTGVIMVGPRVCRSHGPVVAVIEDVERLVGMARAAERIAAVGSGEVVLAIAAADNASRAWIEAQVRPTVAGHANVTLALLGRPGGGTAVVAEALRRLAPGFVIAEHGGIAVPREGDLRPLAAAIECPLLVVR